MTWLEQHPVLLVTAYVSATLIVLAAALAVVRGYFGTPQRRSHALLEDLEESDAVPRSVRRDGANCLGHSGEDLPIRGTGVLYLTRNCIGFLLREPRHRIEIDLLEVTATSATTTFRRPGYPSVELAEPALVVSWTDDEGVVTVIGWSVDDAAAWSREIEAQRRKPHRRRLRGARRISAGGGRKGWRFPRDSSGGPRGT